MKESSYRDNANETELAAERIRQDGETNRKLIEEREKTHRISRTEDGGYMSQWRLVVIGVVALALVGGSTCLGSQHFDVKRVSAEHPMQDGACRDEYLAFGPTGVVMRCNHPMQQAEPRGDSRLFCKCVAQPVPSASVSP